MLHCYYDRRNKSPKDSACYTDQKTDNKPFFHKFPILCTICDLGCNDGSCNNGNNHQSDYRVDCTDFRNNGRMVQNESIYCISNMLHMCFYTGTDITEY